MEMRPGVEPGYDGLQPPTCAARSTHHRAPPDGIEPPTSALTAPRSATELQGIGTAHGDRTRHLQVENLACSPTTPAQHEYPVWVPTPLLRLERATIPAGNLTGRGRERRSRPAPREGPPAFQAGPDAYPVHSPRWRKAAVLTRTPCGGRPFSRRSRVPTRFTFQDGGALRDRTPECHLVPGLQTRLPAIRRSAPRAEDGGPDPHTLRCVPPSKRPRRACPVHLPCVQTELQRHGSDGRTQTPGLWVRNPALCSPELRRIGSCGGTQTPDLLIRNQTLSSTELHRKVGRGPRPSSQSRHVLPAMSSLCWSPVRLRQRLVRDLNPWPPP